MGKLSYSDDYHGKSDNRDHKWALILIPKARVEHLPKFDLFVCLYLRFIDENFQSSLKFGTNINSEIAETYFHPIRLRANLAGLVDAKVRHGN